MVVQPRIVPLLLSLLVLLAIGVSCAGPSAISPPSSEYPADISGHVIIAEKVIAKYDRNKPDTMESTPLEGQIYWIIDISVKNKAYENTVTANYNDWKIVADDKVHDSQKPFVDIWPSTAMSVPVGDTGETTIRFPVPDILEVSSAMLCYQGQEPYSYGKLSGGDRVAVYDWDLKKAVEETEETTTPTPTVIQVTIQELNRAYMGNVLAADAKYKDKILRITGVVAVIQRNNDGTLGMTLTSTRFSSDPVYFSFDREHESELAQLTIGQSVTVQGKCVGDFFGVHVNDCILVR